MSTTIRQQRVAGLLFQELSIMLASELQDPRLGAITVTGVVVSKDLRNVKVFVSHDDPAIQPREVIRRLQHAMPYLRSQVAERLTLRMVPELHFTYDDSPAKVGRLDAIFRQIAAERQGEEDAPAAPAAAPAAQPGSGEPPAQ
jgi:ribosome-binding factor A